MKFSFILFHHFTSWIKKFAWASSCILKMLILFTFPFASGFILLLPNRRIEVFIWKTEMKLDTCCWWWWWGLMKWFYFAQGKKLFRTSFITTQKLRSFMIVNKIPPGRSYYRIAHNFIKMGLASSAFRIVLFKIPWLFHSHCFANNKQVKMEIIIDIFPCSSWFQNGWKPFSTNSEEGHEMKT